MRDTKPLEKEALNLIHYKLQSKRSVKAVLQTHTFILYSVI